MDENPSRHHIVPRSKRGSNNGDNIAIVGQAMHDKYHSLFDNRTPDEILDFLVNYFWRGKVEFVQDYLKKRGLL